MNEVILKEPDLSLYQAVVPAIIPVLDAESEARAAMNLATMRHDIRRIEVGQKEWTSPLEAYKKKIIALFKGILEPLQMFDTAQTYEILRYRQRLEDIRVKEVKRLQELAQKRLDRAMAAGKAFPLPVAIAPAVMPLEKSVEGMTYTETWKAGVTDMGLLPRLYCLPDMPALNALARANKGKHPPPGVAFYLEIGTRVK